MHEDIRLLRELQEVDYWIGELERSRAFLPDMMQGLREEVDQLSATALDCRNRLHQAQIELKETENRVAANKEKREKYQEQMLTIKTNKEYDALVGQIEAAKTEIAKDEERALELMTEIEQLKQQVTQVDEKFTQSKSDNAVRLQELQIQMDSVQGKVDEREAQREHIKTKVPKNLLAIYDRVSKARGGHVVVPLKRNACGECYKSQPPQKIQMIKRGDSIQTCTSCGRILIWEGED